jgi:hypothetical protein
MMGAEFYSLEMLVRREANVMSAARAYEIVRILWQLSNEENQ